MSDHQFNQITIWGLVVLCFVFIAMNIFGHPQKHYYISHEGPANYSEYTDYNKCIKDADDANIAIMHFNRDHPDQIDHTEVFCL